MIDSQVPSLVVCLATGIAAAMDLRRFRVANWLSLSLLLSGLTYQAIRGGWGGLGLALTGAAFGFAVLFVPYAGGGMGAGDVKLGAGLGAWLGVSTTSEVLIAAAVATVAYAIVAVLVSGRVAETCVGVKRLMLKGAVEARLTVDEAMSRPDRRARLVPFAAMLCLGVLASMGRAWMSGS